MIQRQSKGALRNRTRVWLAFVLCFFPVIVSAQDELPREERPYVDWDIIFSENADKIEERARTDGTKHSVLKLPSGIVASRYQTDNKVRYIVRDPNGAVGCLYSRYQHIVMMIEACPADRDSVRGQGILERFERIREFVKENAVPPYTEEEMERGFLRFKEVRDFSSGRSSCGFIDHWFVEAIAGDEAAARLSKILSISRPPVMGDCL